MMRKSRMMASKTINTPREDENKKCLTILFVFSVIYVFKLKIYNSIFQQS